MEINAQGVDFVELNKKVRYSTASQIKLTGVCGQRYIGCALSDKTIDIFGTPGNGLAHYMNGATINVYGNAQDATGDTMNNGDVYIHGSSGDATGYAMRGGQIYIRGNAGYRLGIHMKEYRENKPAIIVGGRASSFLGEYQAGGIIIVLNMFEPEKYSVGDFAGVGMHGGVIYIRGSFDTQSLPAQVYCEPCNKEDMRVIDKYIDKYSKTFDVSKADILSKPFSKLLPNTKNPYKQLYVNN
jgi:glutamate synthase domain-containing protein 3